MAKRIGASIAWAIGAAVLVLTLATVGVVIAVRGGGGRPSAQPTATRPTTARPTATAAPTAAPTTTADTPSSTARPTTTRPTSTRPSTTRPTTPAPTASGSSTGIRTTPPPFPPALRGQDVTVLPTNRRVVALTFDAGANSAGLASILHTLADERAVATFFLTGRWVDANPAGVAAIRAGGHRIGNHTIGHPHLPTLSDAAIRAEVLGAQRTIRAAGADPRPLFRFPFGDRDTRTVAAVNDLGYVAVRWTVDTLGWEGTAGGMSAARVAGRALAALQPGEIVLMHVGSNPDDGTTFDADALHTMIEQMRRAGYRFVTLDALLA
jgi:peptidoglycan-N-acetylglucosamine deacetylase